MAAAQGETRKRSKKYFGFGGYPHSKRWRGSRELEVGMQGILITCNMNQKKCTAEAFDLLNEYADQLYGPEKFQEDEGNYSEGDVDDALRREVAQLKAAPGKQWRFQALESGANNVIFIRTHNLESDKLVHHILSDLHATKKKKTRIILRMLPVMGTCRAFPEEMLRYLSTFLQPWFKKPNRATYQVAFKARNSSHNKREDVIKAIAGLVGKLNSKNRVDLTNPQLTIIVEVIKAVCCISVVREYTRYRKYNLQEVVKDDTPKADDDAPKADDAATVDDAATAEPDKEGEAMEVERKDSDAAAEGDKENDGAEEKKENDGVAEEENKNDAVVEEKENDAAEEEEEAAEEKEAAAEEEEAATAAAAAEEEEAAAEEDKKPGEEDVDEEDEPQDCKDVEGDGE